MVPPLTDARIRVVRVITRLNVGGPALQAMLLTRRLDPARFESVLVAGRPGPREGSMLDLRPQDGVRPIELDALGRSIAPLSDARAFARLLRLMRQRRPHIVHTHLAKAGFLGRVAARLAGVPVVVHTFHGNVLTGYFGAARSRVFLALERWLAGMSTRVIAISPSQADELRRLGIAGDDRLEVVPLGLDLGPFQDAPPGRLRAELGIEASMPLIGIVGRLVPIKGVPVFLEAAALIARERPDVRFVVVGDGELHASLERRASDLGLGGRVRFLGWRADLPAIYADLDVVVLTSWNEGTPVGVIEALASARPVVGTAVGGVPDVLDGGRCGVLVPPGDPDSVRSAVIGLLNDAGRGRELAERGRARVLREHGADALVRRIEALYARLVGSIAMR